MATDAISVTIKSEAAALERCEPHAQPQRHHIGECTIGDVLMKDLHSLLAINTGRQLSPFSP